MMNFVVASTLRDIVSFANNEGLTKEQIVYIYRNESEGNWTMLYFK